MYKIIVNNIIIIRDGGTKEVTTNNGIFFIDNMLFTSSPGRIYKEYPNDDNSNILKNKKLEKEINTAVTEYYDKKII